MSWVLQTLSWCTCQTHAGSPDQRHFYTKVLQRIEELSSRVSSSTTGSELRSSVRIRVRWGYCPGTRRITRPSTLTSWPGLGVVWRREPRVSSWIVRWWRGGGEDTTIPILNTRKRKDADINEIKVKVYFFAFDLLYLNGESLIRTPFRDWW